jgi:hypothetical protein
VTTHRTATHLRHELRDDPELALASVGLVAHDPHDHDDVRVVQLRHHGHLLEKPLGGLALGRCASAYDLARDGGSEILRRKDVAKAAASEETLLVDCQRRRVDDPALSSIGDGDGCGHGVKV